MAEEGKIKKARVKWECSACGGLISEGDQYFAHQASSNTVISYCVSCARDLFDWFDFGPSPWERLRTLAQAGWRFEIRSNCQEPPETRYIALGWHDTHTWQTATVRMSGSWEPTLMRTVDDLFNQIGSVRVSDVSS
jgi:hypothetical protein